MHKTDSMNRNVYYIILFLTLTIPSYDNTQKNYVVTQYSTEDGLPQKTINAIQQDKNGYMWFATRNGISRFDGQNFIIYRTALGDSIGLTDNRINFLQEDTYGYFWLQNYDNYVYRFNPHNGTFQRIPDNDNFKDKKIDILKNGDVVVPMVNGYVYRIYYSQKKNKLTVQKITHVSSTIRSIFIDSDKDIWILTETNLLQYNIAAHKLIRHFQENENLQFYALRRYPDTFYIGTTNGFLYCYNRKKNNFNKVKLPTDADINNIKAYSTNEILARTTTDGFFIYNLETKKAIHYSTETIHLIDNAVRNIYVTHDKNFWITYNYRLGNISYIQTKTNKISHYTLKDKNGKAVNDCNTIRIFEDINNYLMFFSKENILNYYNETTDNIEPFILSDNPELISFNEPTIASIDRQRNLWLGKENRGLIKVSFKKDLFKLTSPQSKDLYALENKLLTILEDNNHNLWFGSADGTLRIYNEKKEFIGFLSPSGQIAQTKVYFGTVYSIIQDRQGIIWIGTSNKGLVKATPKGERIYNLEYFTSNPDNPYSLNCDQIYTLHEDSNGRIWIGTFEGGINYIEKNADGGILFINSSNDLKHYLSEGKNIRCIQTDKERNLWVGTTTGLIQCSNLNSRPDEMQFELFTRIAGDSTSLSNNYIHDIYLSRSNELYLTTSGGGLCRLESFKNGKARFKNYTKTDGLPSDMLLKIQEDNNGNLWIATEEGLCRFSPEQETFETYDYRFFPSNIQFTESNAIYTSNNELIFNSDRGFLSFNPNDIQKDKYKPFITFNDIFVKGRKLVSENGSLLTTDDNGTTSLTLSHANNSFSINYAALDMKYPTKIDYAYKLEGFDNWNDVDNHRTAVYTNIPKGSYTFKVKSTNSDGLWVENEKTMQLTILPSFWESTWGILLLIAIFILIILITASIFLQFYKLKSKVVFEQQLSDVKTKFFTDIVHELRTPFTLIMAPLEHILSMKSNMPDVIQEDLQLMQRNTKRTVRLINQILDFQKIQSHKIKLRIQYVELYSFVQNIIGNFESLAQSQGTEIILNTSSKDIHVWIDTDKMENVMFNLISNAFKYSPKGKNILISINEEKEFVTLSVSDQGYGMTPEKQKLAFTRFENYLNNSIIKQPSTGIGLSLVKEMIELHKGTIELQSVPNEGTTFNITLLKGKEHFEKGTEFVLTDYHISEEAPNTVIDDTLEEEKESIDANSDLLTILIVEDNNELRHFLRTILSEQFQVITAKNGKEGLDKAIQYNPDMIVSDMVMPVMNGIEMIKNIRSNLSICHIPIIMLTSKASVENQIEGLQLGIEDYITKPFSANYLKARIYNLIEQRKKLQALFSSQIMASPKEREELSKKIDVKELEVLSPYDKETVNKMVTYIKDNIGDANLSVEELARQMGFSRSALFKKIKILTGLAPIELIKNIRIQQAVELIKEGQQNLTQIAYTTGFSDSHYFSKCFKQAYGMTPSEYKKSIF